MSSFINRTIEKGILSYVFFSQSIDSIRDVREDYFGDAENKKIFKAILDLDRNYKPINESFIEEELDSYGIQEVSMLEVIAESPLMPSQSYKDLLEELSYKRKFSALLRDSLTRLTRTSTMELAQSLKERAEDTLNQVLSTEDTFDMIAITDIDEPPVEIVGNNYLPLPRNSVVLLAGKGGIGKSSIALQAAIRHIVSTGEKVFAWLSEDPLGETKQRAENICKGLGIDLTVLEGKLFITKRRTFNIALKDRDTIEKNPELKKLQFATQDFGLIILDPLRSFASNFDENSNSDMDNVTKEFAQWAKKEKKILLVIHHASKEGQIRGASSIVDASRLAYIVEEGQSQGVKKVIIRKDNFGIANIVNGDTIMLNSLG